MKKNNIFSFAIVIVSLFILSIMMVWLFNVTVPTNNNNVENIVSEEMVEETIFNENIVYKNKYTLMSEISSLSKQITEGKENGEDVSELILQYGILYAQLHEFKEK